MAYEHKPGKGSIFPNERKEKETQPDMKGTAKLPNGQDVRLSLWHNKFGGFNFSIEDFQPQNDTKQYAPTKAAPRDDLPPVDAYDF